MPRKRGRKPDPRVKMRQARLITEMYAALDRPHGLVISSLTPASDAAFCRERTQDPVHPKLAALTVRRNAASPDEIFLMRNDIDE